MRKYLPLLLVLPLFAYSQSLPGRIDPSHDLIYLGAFRLPSEHSGGTSWSSGGVGMTFNPNGDPSSAHDGYPGSLFSIGTIAHSLVSEFTIPVPRISPNKVVTELNSATTLQPFIDVTAGRKDIVETDKKVLGDIQYFAPLGNQSTSKLYWAMYINYMPPTWLNTIGWCESTFSNLTSVGAWHVGSFPSSATSQFLFDIPASWADTYLNGRYLASGRFRVVNDGSFGPSVYATAPWRDGNPPNPGSQLSAIELLKYTTDNPMNNFSNADEWLDGAWLEFGTKSGVLIAGTKAVRIRGTGELFYGLTPPDGCGDKGFHGEPYYPALLFYDPADLAAVARGVKPPYSPQPYATMQLEHYRFRSGCQRSMLGGVGFDRQNKLLYLMERGVAYGLYERAPIVHVFRLIDAGRQLDSNAPSAPTNLRATASLPSYVDLAWQASQDEDSRLIYIVYRNDLPIAITTDLFYHDDKSSLLTTLPLIYKVVSRDSLNNESPHAQVVLNTQLQPTAPKKLVIRPQP